MARWLWQTRPILAKSENSEVTLQLNSAAVTFTADNWHHEVTVNIESDDDFYTDWRFWGGAARALTCPLLIEGGIGEGKDRSLVNAVMLPPS